MRKDGSVYRGRPENVQGAHTIGYNAISIGVCFEGNFETETMSDAQYNSGAKLVRDILKRYPNVKIGGHREYDTTSCPGKNFPLEKMVRRGKDGNEATIIYRVQVGAFGVSDNADKLAAELKAKGYSAFVVKGVTRWQQTTPLKPDDLIEAQRIATKQQSVHATQIRRKKERLGDYAGMKESASQEAAQRQMSSNIYNATRGLNVGASAQGRIAKCPRKLRLGKQRTCGQYGLGIQKPDRRSIRLHGGNDANVGMKQRPTEAAEVKSERSNYASSRCVWTRTTKRKSTE